MCVKVWCDLYVMVQGQCLVMVSVKLWCNLFAMVQMRSDLRLLTQVVNFINTAIGALVAMAGLVLIR